MEIFLNNLKQRFLGKRCFFDSGFLSLYFNFGDLSDHDGCDDAYDSGNDKNGSDEDCEDRRVEDDEKTENDRKDALKSEHPCHAAERFQNDFNAFHGEDMINDVPTFSFSITEFA
jgi:hypothetical protein